MTRRVAAATGGGTVVAGYDYWAEADALGLSPDDPIAAWAGKGTSGGVSAINASVGARPLYKTNILNGHPAALFDGSNDILRASLSFAGTASTVYVLGSKSGAGGDQNTYSRLASCWNTSNNPAYPGDFGSDDSAILCAMTTQSGFGAAPPAAFAYRNGSSLGAATIAYGTFYLWTCRHNGTVADVWLNDTHIGTASTSAAALNSDQLLLGGSPAGTDSELNGYIVGVLVYASAANSDGDCATNRAYWLNKYGL